MSNEINGTDNIQYNYVQTAKMLGESDSTIRYWVDQFKDILHLKKINGKTIRFTMKDIENLKFIQTLIREEHYTIDQVREYCSKRFENSPETISMDNQLQIKAFVTALTTEFDRQLQETSEKLLNQQKDLMIKLLESQVELNQETKKQITNALEGVMTDAAEGIRDTNKEMLDNTVNQITKSNDELKGNIDKVNENINVNYDKLDKYWSEIKDISEDTKHNVAKISEMASVTADQIKEYQNRGLKNKIKNLFGLNN